MAFVGAFIVYLRVADPLRTRWFFCHDSACYVEALLLSLPGHIAMLAMLVPAVAIAAALNSLRVGPTILRVAALTAAIGSIAAYSLGLVIHLDVAWGGAFSGTLIPPPYGHRFLPGEIDVLLTPLWTWHPILFGVWLGLTSIQLLALRAPAPLVAAGIVLGAGLVVAMPYAFDRRVYDYVLPSLFVAVLVWAFAVAAYGGSDRSIPA